MTALEALQRAPLFKDFSAGGLETLAEMAHERTIPAGSPLFVEGMVGESLFVVVAGTVRVVQRAGGDEQPLPTLVRGRPRRGVPPAARTLPLDPEAAGRDCAVHD